jgi:RNA polymerase sigma-70 factor (ECF subfamily)
MGAMADELAAETARLSVTLDFPVWMQAEQRRVFLLCRHMLQDLDEADSATQDIFFKAYKALQRPESESIEHPDQWLTRIAVNTCLDRLRSQRWQFWRRSRKTSGSDEALDRSPCGRPDPEAGIFASEIEGRIRAALTKLSIRQRAVFTLRHYDNLPLEEIAVLLGLEVGSVKSHLARALAKMREELRDLYGYRR